MEEKRYGEVKTRKNLYPSDARKMVEKGTIDILISQCKVSDKTKEILDSGNIILYEGVEANEVEKLNEKLDEILKEKIEKERE